MSRVLSIIIVIFQLIGAYMIGDGKAFMSFLAFFLLPLGCIWFSDEIGKYTGPSGNLGFGSGRYISEASPSAIVKFVGWILLFLPIVIYLIALSIR